MSTTPLQPPAGWPQHAGRAPTILAVDDDQAVLNLMEVILRDAGYRVLLANRGWSAIKLSQNHTEPLDLLITDVVMPDLTGPVVAERLLVQRPHLRVLFVSGLYDADLVQRFVIRRGFTLLEKPFTAPSLLRVVQEALSAGRPT